MRQLTGLVAFVAIIVTAACGGGGSGGGSGTVPTTGFVATSVQDALDYGVDRGLDGVWVYAEKGSSTTNLAAGIQDRGTLDPARAQALFKIASISKMFIAASSVKLVHANMLALDDTLAFWLPALAARIDNAGTITVRQLLQHRSGVPDFDSQVGFSWQAAHTDNDALLAFVLDKAADFAPGARYEYSNTNYLLLGKILDVALGYSHHDYVQNTILSPLGMIDTYSLLADANSAFLAHGYWGGTDRSGQDYVAPGGSMISTTKDVGIFLRALATGSLLSGQERAVYASLFDGYAHSGWLPGYQSIARYDRNSNLVLVVFVNTTGGSSEATTQTVFDSLLTYLRSN